MVAPNPVEYAQNTFLSALLEAEVKRKPLHIESIIRRICAYGLKGIAVFGGIAIASGLYSKQAQYIGIAITLAVALDGFFSNYVKMMLVTKAAQAYSRLANEARRSHQLRLTPILQVIAQQPVEGNNQLVALLIELTGKLQSGCAEIENANSEGHIKALEGLSLDSERSKPSNP